MGILCANKSNLAPPNNNRVVMGSACLFRTNIAPLRFRQELERNMAVTNINFQ